VEAHAGSELVHAATDLKQAEAERVKLQGRQAAREQPVGGRMQEQAELVGTEAVVAQAVGDSGGCSG